VRTRCSALAVGLLASVVPFYGDDWPGPQVRERFSASREFMVRIVPGNSWGDTVGFKGSSKGPYARAEWYRQDQTRSYRFLKEVTLLNPVAPVEFFVTDSCHLATFDNWHNVGYGKVAVFYGADGVVAHAYTLNDLFAAAEISGFEQSVSSIWWHKAFTLPHDGQPPLMKGQKNFCVVTGIKNRDVEFDLDNGSYRFREAGYCSPR